MEIKSFSQQSTDYQRIEKAIQYIGKHFRSQPTLDQIAASVNLSKFHFDRIFKRWAGISPMRFQQFLTLDYTKQKLAAARSLLDTSLEAGLSGPSRLHDLFVTFEAMTPGEYKNGGTGLEISYGFSDSPFGTCLIAHTRRGICYLAFAEKERHTQAYESLFQRWPGATFNETPQSVQSMAKHIFSLDQKNPRRPFNLHLKGTNFQINVWKALLRIPEGWFVSYQDIAAHIGRPMATRAVAGAVAINPVAYLIPCHRVISKSGKIHKYRWGMTRKKALVGWEAARSA